MRSACAIHVRSSATRPSRVRAVVVAWIAGSPPTMSRSAPGARSIFASSWNARRAASGSLPLPTSSSPTTARPSGALAPTTVRSFAVFHPAGKRTRKSRSGWRNVSPSKTPLDARGPTGSPSSRRSIPPGPATGAAAVRARVAARASVSATRSGSGGWVAKNEFGRSSPWCSVSSRSRVRRDRDRPAGSHPAAAGRWDPAGLSRSLRTLERDDTLHHGEERPNSFFATHPPLPDRVADTEARAATLARTAAAPVAGPGGMLRRLDGLPVGPRASNGVFDGETFLHPDLDFRVRFPAGWKTANERTVVGASAPDGRAVVGLELVGKGSDPEAALRALQEEAKIDLAPGAERLMVGGLPAIHATTTARTRDGRVALDLTWIAHAERIYRVIGAAPPDGAAAAKPFFRATVESFRPLTASERAGIRETRVRIVAARAGEGLADVLARARSTWTVETAAVANGLDATARLRPAKLVKVAVAEPYTHEQ